MNLNKQSIWIDTGGRVGEKRRGWEKKERFWYWGQIYQQILGNTTVTIAIVSSLAKKAGTSADTNRAWPCSNRGDEKNKYQNSKPIIAADKVYTKM